MTDSPTRQRAPLANTECLDAEASRVVDEPGEPRTMPLARSSPIFRSSLASAARSLMSLLTRQPFSRR